MKYVLFMRMMSLFCIEVLSVLSNFCNHIAEEERACCLTLIVFLLSCLCLWERSGSVVECLTPRPRGCGFEPHPRHCLVSLSKTH